MSSALYNISVISFSCAKDVSMTSHLEISSDFPWSNVIFTRATHDGEVDALLHSLIYWIFLDRDEEVEARFFGPFQHRDAQFSFLAASMK